MSQKKHPKVGVVYLIWAVGTDRFKVGYTSGTSKSRAYTIEQSSPFPLKVIADMPGDVTKERDIQAEFSEFNTHREWFKFPEEAVWKLLAKFGIGRDYAYAVAHLV